MKKILIAVAAAFVLALVGLVIVGSMQPDVIHVERSVRIEGVTVADVVPLVEDLKLVNTWSPWEGRDPNIVTAYSEATTGVGAWYTWEGNKDVGTGKQTITGVEPGKVRQSLEFIEPFPSVADVYVAYTASDDGLDVTWGFDQQADLTTKIMCLFMDMDAMLGPDFAAGLAMLDGHVRAAAEARVAEEEQAAEAARAKADAEGDGEDDGAPEDE